MIDRLKIWLNSKRWFWSLRAWFGKLDFALERNAYTSSASATRAKSDARILGSIAWIGLKSLFGVVLILLALNLIERLLGANLRLIPPLDAADKEFFISQLRLYAQLLTTIFAIYFATIGIILSAGYTKLRRDIIQMLTNEQVGSVYSRVLVHAAIFCVVATALSSFGFEPGLFAYAAGTVLTLLSALALFPLGQRLFNFFDLNLLVRSEILPSIARHIEAAANQRNSISLANHHSRAARLALEQLSYIDDRIKAANEELNDNLPKLSDAYGALLLHYFQQKHAIDQESYWFPRRRSHKQWFLAGDSATSIALQTSNQQMLVEDKPDRQWFENQIVDKLVSHIELAFQIGDLDLALKLIGRFSNRIAAYADRFQFDVGLQEIKNIKSVIEKAFGSSEAAAQSGTVEIHIAIADTWAALGSNLCLEALRRMITFEKELKKFFLADEWSKKSLRHLPAFLQVDLALIVERIEFEEDIEGRRLSKPKYVQQLAVQRLLEHYANVLPAICDFYQNLIPDFVDSLARQKMSEAATQVLLASLHSHWKLPRWFDEIGQLLHQYHEYAHYTEDSYKLPEIGTEEMNQQFASARDQAITRLSSAAMVAHIFDSRHNDEMPDHFGQIYFELAEACIKALDQNDIGKLDKVLPMFMSLAILAADSKFADPSFDVNDEFRLHLISTVINDLASVLGFAILYGAYFDNQELSKRALARFDKWIKQTTDKQKYLKRMILLSNPYNFSMSASPRSLIRINWKISFEHRARADGFGGQLDMGRMKPHHNKIVREFLRSTSDASHLFFAKQVVPQLDPIDFEIDRHITTLARQLDDDHEHDQHEDLQG